MKHVLQRVGARASARRARLLGAALLLGALVAAVVIVGRPAGVGSADGQWVALQVGETSQAIVLDGQLEPGASVNITAPFDGRIVAKAVRPGDRVEQGALLLALSSVDLLTELRDAEAAVIRAQQALNQVIQWETGADFLAAQRQLGSSRAALEAAQRRQSETQALFEQGIVARNELESVQSELLGAQSQVVNGESALTAAREKGSAEQHRLARLEHDNRVSKLADLRTKLGQARIAAPIAGVVSLPAAAAGSDGGVPKEPEVGSFVTPRETLLTIGDTSTFMVRAGLDEYDILRVKTGLTVEVVLNANPDVSLTGELLHISSQARKNTAPGEGSSRAAVFDVQVVIRDIAPQARSALRIGMGVGLRIHPEAGRTALLVPLPAVSRGADGSAHVMRRGQAGGPAGQVRIELGKTLVDQVEVVTGLEPGDEVWLPRPAEVPSVADGPPALPGVSRPTDE
ncbi:MAG TPA: HlyD family efflux transporter periplasmic adaptor subunit [Methylibium sp.]|uniref:efflux RND transporter periplasmic adaptor subunit n=1 Tax=Methylibium sp. TaxID=2067992 RepID=UPI002DB7A8AC|nr:HlyD family efflux transporter periplasmic adaptor subunit [Methylibium sp.]HEU4460528.1 HlyD family efflux transporter periplasmic adaptor subunit [Methylibium sp.]